ncbi:MAG: ABC transporter ATP-binding protein [Planctomycetes bacterium]|nr:ABC transporter ATP-binding protein [Planctomycetota bacterium]
MPDLLESTDPSRGDRALEGPLVRAPLSLVNGARIANKSESLEAKDSAAAELGPKTGPPVLFFDRVSRWYGPVIGVNGVTLELRSGITGLVGHNGSGKSTLMRLAAGHLRPDLGAVLVEGRQAWTAEAKRHVGYCPELDTYYEEMSGRRFIQCMARLSGFSRAEARSRGDEVLELVGMADRAQRPLAGYSKGMRQRIKLAQALIHDPKLLLLDEPLSGIDPIGRRESIQLFHKLAGRGKCLLISSHELEELEKLTDHVAIMAAGRIAAVGPLTQIRDLLDDHPLSIRVASDQNKVLATALLDCDDVVGLDRLPDDALLVRARNPRRFFQRLTELVISEHLEISHLESLDESTHDVLGYLLGGKS